MSAAATAGAALAGSAVPSLGEKTPPFQARPVAWPRSAASRPLSMCVVTPAVFAKSRQLGPAGNLGLVIAEIQQAAAVEARVFAAVGGKLLPEIEALGRHGQFARVAVLLAAPAPVAARLLGADPALFDHGDRQAAPGQVVGGEDTDDAAADHDDVGAGRRLGRSLDVAQRRGHGGSRSSLQAWHALHDVELRDAIAAFPPDRRALGHEERIAGARRQHAAIGGRESHAAGQQMHELVEAMRANDPVVGRRIPGARAVLRAARR